MDLAYLGTILLLVFGFGFVIFWHELGHFLAAKWAGVKVEQFAVGFGNAMFSWRKGLGFRSGSSAKEYETRVLAHLGKESAEQLQLKEKLEYRNDQFERAANDLGIGETEYRLNWIPLGGYVKMLGQDDMDPNSISDSPRAYNNKPIPKRMVIVSAGVVMNIILAILLFTILFRMGFNVPPPVVGRVQPGSPAQEAGIKVGDRILTYDGVFQHDFNKIFMNVALSREGEAVPVQVRHPDGKEEALSITPRRSEGPGIGFLQIGISNGGMLQGPDSKKLAPEDIKELADEPVRPDETIVAINGQPVAPQEQYKLNEAVADGQPAHITVLDASGAKQERIVTPSFIQPFGRSPLNFSGLVPRARVEAVESFSSALNKLKHGDIIEEFSIDQTNDTIAHPSYQKLMDALNNAGKQGVRVGITVIRDGQRQTYKDLDPTKHIDENRKGLGIGLGIDTEHPVVADVLPGSAADAAHIPSGATIKQIDGKDISSWRDVQRALANAKPDAALKFAVATDAGETKELEFRLSESQIHEVRQNAYAPDVALRELSEPRKTGNPFVAAGWGVTETRDLTLQFYLTLRRMISGSVPASGAMGPIGIFHQGSKIAYRGMDWLIWFLAMISANLAVVNFLPIPIVDGGLFVFLILEKIMGKPLSPKAQSIAQIVGLALIASVFLFVTYHDIARLIL